MKSKHKKGAKRAAARRAAAEKVATEKVATEKVATEKVASKRNNRKNASLRREAAKRRNSTTSELIQWLIAILVAFIIALFVDNFLIVNAQIPSGSMENTIMTGDRVVGNRLSYLTKDPERYDVIIFKYPDDESQNFVKRVIGIPGDVINIRNGYVYVNGEMLEENYIREPMNSDGEDLTYVVPSGSYFMLGDNRNNSKDSRYWINTFVSKDKIIAKVSFRYFNVRTKRFSFSFIK